MATARVIHHEEDLNPLQISIPAGGVISPTTYIIANQQQVTFNNNSGSPVNITFEADAFGVVVFNNISNLTTSTTQTPQVNNRTVNFNTDGSTTYPYAIQVGNGPMYVNVDAGECTPETVVIPLNGTIQMASSDGVTYSITWNTNNGNPFPGLAHIYPVSNPQTKPYTATFPIGPYGYTIAVAKATGGGGGTVKIKST
jgi:hypothetical protein